MSDERFRQQEFQERRTSFGRGVDAAAYADLRPGYPTEAVRRLVGDEPREVLDLGAGTGKLTEQLVALGHRVVAVDPSEPMLHELSTRLPGVDVRVGTGEQLPLADASVDVVVCGQAWHWVDPVAGCAEVARVLRPGGSLGLVWNVLDTRRPWVAELDALTGDGKGSAGPAGVDVDAIAVVAAPFGATERHDETMLHRLPGPAAVAALAATWSWVAGAPDRSEVLREVERLAAAHVDPDGSVTLPHVTATYRSVLHG